MPVSSVKLEVHIAGDTLKIVVAQDTMSTNGRVSGTGTPEVNIEYLEAVSGATKEVESLLEQTKCVPLLLRLAYHDAMTYDSNTKTGGANGSIRVQRELDHAGNESLSSAMELLEPIKTKYQLLTYAGSASSLQLPVLPGRLVKCRSWMISSKITFLMCFADLFQLSGIMAVRVAGGPFINFTPGEPAFRCFLCTLHGT